MLISLPEQLLSSQEDKTKKPKYLLEKFVLRVFKKNIPKGNLWVLRIGLIFYGKYEK